MMKQQNTRKITMLAIFSAMAFILVALIRIPVVLFLNYEPKDVIIAISGFLVGPVGALLVSTVVGLIEMVTISATGYVGAIMNILASASYACTAAIIYRKKKTLKGAILGLIVGTLLMTTIMIVWNYVITPLYMGMPRDAVVSMLVPVFLPFNLVKGAINSSIVLLIYKPVVTALRKARIAEIKTEAKAEMRWSIKGISVLVLLTCVLVVFVWRNAF